MGRTGNEKQGFAAAGKKVISITFCEVGRFKDWVNTIWQEMKNDLYGYTLAVGSLQASKKSMLRWPAKEKGSGASV